MSQTDPTAAQCEGLRPPSPVQSDLGQLEAYTAVFNIFPEPIIVGVEGKQEPFPNAFWSPVVTLMENTQQSDPVLPEKFP